MIWYLVDAMDNILGTVLWDPKEGMWEPAAGYRLVPGANGFWRDGWKWDSEKQCAYDANPPPPPPPEPPIPPQEAPNVVT